MLIVKQKVKTLNISVNREISLGPLDSHSPAGSPLNSLTGVLVNIWVLPFSKSCAHEQPDGHASCV